MASAQVRYKNKCYYKFVHVALYVAIAISSSTLQLLIMAGYTRSHASALTPFIASLLPTNACTEQNEVTRFNYMHDSIPVYT